MASRPLVTEWRGPGRSPLLQNALHIPLLAPLGDKIFLCLISMCSDRVNTLTWGTGLGTHDSTGSFSYPPIQFPRCLLPPATTQKLLVGQRGL